MINDEYHFYLILYMAMFIGVNVQLFLHTIRSNSMKIGFSIFLASCISLITGVRGYGIGLDTRNYATMYEKQEFLFSEPILTSMFKIFNFLNFDTHLVLLILALFFNIVILYSLILIIPRDFSIAMSLYYSTMFFVSININILRQGLAVCIFLFSIALLLHNKRRKAFLFYTTASLSHFSAIFPSLTFFITRSKITNPILLLIFLTGCLFSFVSLSDLLFPIKDFHPLLERLHWYFSWPILKPWGLKHFYYLAIALLIAYFIFYKRLNFHPYNQTFLIYCFGFILLTLFREEEMVADRIFYYFFPVVFILITGLKHIIKEKRLYYFFVFLSVNAWLFKTMFLQFPKWYIFPYEAIR